MKQQQQQLARLFLFLLSTLGASHVGSAAGTRYTVSGPTLTITLQEPKNTPPAAGGGGRKDAVSNHDSAAAAALLLPSSSWLADWSKLRPTVHAGIQSQGPPLPKWFPAFQSIRAGILYTFGNDDAPATSATTAATSTTTATSHARIVKQQLPLHAHLLLPTWLEVTGKFALNLRLARKNRTNNSSSELHVQPSYQFATQEMNLQVQLISQGASYLYARLSNHNNRNSGGGGGSSGGVSSSSSSSRRRPRRTGSGRRTSTRQARRHYNRLYLQTLRGSVLWNVPTRTTATSTTATAAAAAAAGIFQRIRITPTIDWVQQQQQQAVSCTIEAVTGDRRTKAVLHLERQHPTLTVVYAFNDRNVIAPEINLYNGRMMYQWNCQLGGGSSTIQTKVDPLSAIHITWTDASAASAGSGGGKWITDVRLPLEGHVINGLAADLRVRRQFSF